MDTQADYEAQIHMAVFPSAASAQAAARALDEAGLAYTQTRLPPGRYQLEDQRMGRYTRAVIGAVIVGAVVGITVGIGLALWLFGLQTKIITWLAVAGAGGGAIVGGLVGMQVTARYDAGVAGTIDVGPDQSDVLITTQTTQLMGGASQARTLLRDNGAVAFLDVSSFQARERAAHEGVIVESTSAGR